MIPSGVASGWPCDARRISSHATRAAIRYAARIGSTDWLLRACRMPSWATRRSSSWVAGRACRAVARNRSRPASQARAIASRWGGTPVDASQRTTPTTARAMCLAIPARRASSSAMRAGGSWGATRADLDLGATFAIGHDYTDQPTDGHDVEGPVKTLLAPTQSGRILRRWQRTPRVGGFGGGPVGLAVFLDEGQDSPPRVVARILPLREAAVEEAVRRVFVDLRLVLDACLGEGLVEVARDVERRRRVRSRHHQQQRSFHLRDVRLAAAGPAVETDGAVQFLLHGGLVVRVGSAKAEADGENRFHGAAVLRPEVGDRLRGVGRNAFGRGLLNMRHEIESVASVPDPGGAAEVIDRHGVDARLRKALRELLVKTMETTHVGQNDHPGSGRFRRPRKVRGELRAVRRGEDHFAVVRGRSTDRRQGWSGFISVAHKAILA